jgi:hypothetical protein
VTVEALLGELRARRVAVRWIGERLRLEAPRGILTAELRAALTANREALRAALRAGELPDPALDEEPLAETRERLGAVLIRSPRFGAVWMVLDPCAAPELEAEEQAREEPRPVLLAEDVARLRGKPDAAVRAALERLRAFPGARVVS